VVVSEAFHRYLGVAIGECLGYLFTGAWTMLVGMASLQSSTFQPWLAWPGIAIGLFLVAGSLEFVGPFEEQGWKLAGTIVPIAYTAWSRPNVAIHKQTGYPLRTVQRWLDAETAKI
jgi:hypothetical protein